MTRTVKQDTNNSFYTAVIVILILRLCSYFMLSEEVVVTQLLKIILRISVTSWVLALLAQRSRMVRDLSFRFDFPVSILLYVSYLALGVVSLFWTSSFSDSLLHLLMDIETLVFCYLFIKLILTYNYNREKTVRISKIAAVAIFVICAGFIAGMIINPLKFYRFTHGGEEARLGGFIINPNELGMLIVIGIATAFIELKHAYNKWSKWLMMGILLYALLLTGSRSSMIGLMLIILYFVSQSKTMRMRIIIIAALAAVTPFIIQQVFIKQGDIQEVLNMTGRIPFWRDLMTINFPREPLLGYGYMRIDYFDKFESINSYSGAMTHNTFLQVLMGLGLTGLFIVFFQLIFTMHAIFANEDADRKRLCIAILIPVLINSFTEFGIFGETNFGILMYLFIVFSLVLKPQPLSLRIKRTNVTGSDKVFRPSAAARPVL